MQLARGTLLERGKYRILETLGRGGFGVTYLAEQVMAKRKVCIKEFFPKDYYKRDGDSGCLTLSSDGFAEMMGKFKVKFVKEAQTIAALDHPNIIPIHDVFEENGTAYYVMDYVDGESLSDKVKRSGALSEADAVAYIRQVAEALDYIHAQQIMHLDVKPGNVMVRSKDNRALLIDFGLSKHYDTNSGEATSTTPVGVSHGYAPIEQYQQGGIGLFSPETDIYSLGATLYYLVTGKTPPQAAIVGEQGVDLGDGVSPNVRNAIEHAMQYWRKDRPRTIKEFMALLAPGMGAVPEKTTSPKRNPEQPQRNKKSRWWLWLVMVAILAGAAAYIFMFREDTSKKGSDTKVDNKTTSTQYHDSIEEYYTQGLTYLNESNYTEAVKFFRQAAEQGHAGAQNNLGHCYYKGYGVPQNYTIAVEWYRKAAEQGDAMAQNNLGYCYANGYGVPQDYNKVVEWYRKAAEQGLASAQCSLGYSYEKGYGVTQDYSKAVEWYRKAAEQGDAMAQFNLGLCYEKGDGVTQDYSKAVEWYRKAAEQGNATAQYKLGYCYANGYGVPQNYTIAVEWLRKAAEQGNAEAQSCLGYCYYSGYGVPQDYNKAVEWYRKAARQGETTAQNNLRYLGESW